VTRWLRVALALTLLATGCVRAKPESELGARIPPLRQQIIDHINAYIRSITCRTEGWGCFSVLRVSERAGRRDPDCQVADNGIAELAYHAPEVESIVYQTLRDNLETGLELRRSLQALWMLALGPFPSDCDPRVEKRLRSLFWKAAPLSRSLLEEAGARIGCRDCRSGPCESTVRRQEILDLLESLQQGHRTWSGLWRGIAGLRGQPRADPVLAVAIARSAASFEDVPSPGAVQETLEAMGCAVRP